MSQQQPTSELYTASQNEFPELSAHLGNSGKFACRENNPPVYGNKHVIKTFIEIVVSYLVSYY